jgi:hypothetical protein
VINAKSLYYSKLVANTALTTLLGGTAHIANACPEVITTFPFVAFTDDDQDDSMYADNVPHSSNVRVRIDIYTKINAGMPTTFDIGELVYNVFTALYFHCGTNGEVSDPTEGVRHRVMRFSREVIS